MEQPADATWWFRDEGVANGPYTGQQMAELRRAGHIEAWMLCSADGATWRAADAFEVFPGEAPLPPDPVPVAAPLTPGAARRLAREERRPQRPAAVVLLAFWFALPLALALLGLLLLGLHALGGGPDPGFRRYVRSWDPTLGVAQGVAVLLFSFCVLGLLVGYLVDGRPFAHVAWVVLTGAGLFDPDGWLQVLESLFVLWLLLRQPTRQWFHDMSVYRKERRLRRRQRAHRSSP